MSLLRGREHLRRRLSVAARMLVGKGAKRRGQVRRCRRTIGFFDRFGRPDSVCKQPQVVVEILGYDADAAFGTQEDDRMLI